MDLIFKINRSRRTVISHLTKIRIREETQKFGWANQKFGWANQKFGWANQKFEGANQKFGGANEKFDQWIPEY